jgi:hypothetical protein
MLNGIARMRALRLLWGTTNSLKTGTGDGNLKSAWIPLSRDFTCQLYESVGLYERQLGGFTCNPWNDASIAAIYEQSAHHYARVKSIHDPHFKEWVANACKMQRPSDSFVPWNYAQGTPVQADFELFRVEPSNGHRRARHAQIIRNRFATLNPLGIGLARAQPIDTLQNWFARDDTSAKVPIYVSSFLALMRQHCIIALSSSTAKAGRSDPHVVRSLYRCLSDSPQAKNEVDALNPFPRIYGIAPPGPLESKWTVFALHLSCMQEGLEQFCASPYNANERVCKLATMAMLNEVALAEDMIKKEAIRKKQQDVDFAAVVEKRKGKVTRAEYNSELIDVQARYISTLHQRLVEICAEYGLGGDVFKSVDIQLLEPRQVTVPARQSSVPVLAGELLGGTEDGAAFTEAWMEGRQTPAMMAFSTLLNRDNALFAMSTHKKSETLKVDYARRDALIRQQTEEEKKRRLKEKLQSIMQGIVGLREASQSGTPLHGAVDLTMEVDPEVAVKQFEQRVRLVRNKPRPSPNELKTSQKLKEEHSQVYHTLAAGPSELQTQVDALERLVYDRRSKGIPDQHTFSQLPEPQLRLLKERLRPNGAF